MHELTIRLSGWGLSYEMRGSGEHFVPLTAGRSLRKALQMVVDGAQWVPGTHNNIHILLDTPKNVLVPTELFEPQDAEHYLHINNMSPAPSASFTAREAGESVASLGEEVIIAAINAEITAIMAFGSESLDTVRGVFGREICFGTPFERVLTGGGTKIYLTGAHLYAAVWREGTPVWVDMLPYATLADLRYYAAELTGQFTHLAHTRVQISGLGAHAAVRELRKIFTGVCE